MGTQVIKKSLIPSPSIIRGRWFIFFILFFLCYPQVSAVCTPQEALQESGDTSPTTNTKEKIYVSGNAVLYIAEGATVYNAELVHSKAIKPKKKANHKQQLLTESAAKKRKEKTIPPQQQKPTEYVNHNPFSHSAEAGYAAAQKLTIVVRNEVSILAPFTSEVPFLTIDSYASLDSPARNQPYCNFAFTPLFQRPPPSLRIS